MSDRYTTSVTPEDRPTVAHGAPSADDVDGQVSHGAVVGAVGVYDRPERQPGVSSGALVVAGLLAVIVALVLFLAYFYVA